MLGSARGDIGHRPTAPADGERFLPFKGDADVCTTANTEVDALFAADK